jgi:hypothetical protein
LTIRVWSYAEREAHETKFGVAGDQFVGGLIGGFTGRDSTPVMRAFALALAEQQRVLVGRLGRSPVFDMLQRTLISASVVSVDGSTRSFDTPDLVREWLEGLDAPLFDVVANAVGLALELTEADRGNSPASAGGNP